METENVALYKRLIARERSARKAAEAILEQKSTELYALSEELKKSNDCLFK